MHFFCDHWITAQCNFEIVAATFCRMKLSQTTLTVQTVMTFFQCSLDVGQCILLSKLAVIAAMESSRQTILFRSHLSNNLTDPRSMVIQMCSPMTVANTSVFCPLHALSF